MTTRALEAGARARIVAAAQQAIMNNGFHNGNPVSAFGFANSAYDAILAHLAAEGFVVVPVEPSDKMICAALDDYDKRGRGKQSYRNIYTAMIAAAQEPSNASEDGRP